MAHTLQPRYEALREMLTNPTFALLAEEAVHDYIDWEQLMTRRIPPDMTPAETWDLLAILRKYAAIRFPIPDVKGRVFWYTITVDGMRCLQTIEHHCRSDSALHLTVKDRMGSRFLVRSRIDEAIATCQLDGVKLDWDRSVTMLREGRTPSTAEEHLLRNVYDVLSELESLSEEPFSPELVTELYLRVSRGVDASKLVRSPARTNLAGTRNPEEDPLMGQAALQLICDYANKLTGDPREPISIRGYMIRSAMAYWHPLPDFNDTVARHMLRLFAIKNDYPVLGYLSSSVMMRQWFDRELEPGTVRFEQIARRPQRDGDIDGTEDILTFLQLTTAAIAQLLQHISQAREEEKQLDSLLDRQEALNYRQRAVLAHALAHPDAEIHIKEHQTDHQVVYQTARTDLLTLEQRGYLRMEVKGKTFVFRPAENLEGLLGNGQAG